VLHHLGESTQKDVEEVAGEMKKIGRESVIVAGDISDPETSKKVRPHQSLIKALADDT
jgi:hypothetical protein